MLWFLWQPPKGQILRSHITVEKGCDFPPTLQSQGHKWDSRSRGPCSAGQWTPMCFLSPQGTWAWARHLFTRKNVLSRSGWVQTSEQCLSPPDQKVEAPTHSEYLLGSQLPIFPTRTPPPGFLAWMHSVWPKSLKHQVPAAQPGFSVLNNPDYFLLKPWYLN